MRFYLLIFLTFFSATYLFSQDELEIKIWKSDTIPNAAEILNAQKTNPQLYFSGIKVYSDEIKFTYKTESGESNYSIKQPSVIPTKPVILTLEDGKNIYMEYKPADVQPKAYWKRTIQLVLKEGEKLIENFEIEGTEKYNYDHQNVFVAIDKEKQQVILQFYSNENNDAKILFYYDLVNKKLISKKKTTEVYYPAGNGEYYALDLSLDQKITVAKYNFNGDKIASFDVATNVNDLYAFSWSSYFKKWYPTVGAFVFVTAPDYNGDVTVYVLDNNLRVFNKALVLKSRGDNKIILDNGSLWLYYVKNDDSNNKTVMRTDLLTGRDRTVYKSMFPITAYRFSENSNVLHIGVNTVNKELSNQIAERSQKELIRKKNEEELLNKLKKASIKNEVDFQNAKESVVKKFNDYKETIEKIHANIGDANQTKESVAWWISILKSISKTLTNQKEYIKIVIEDESKMKESIAAIDDNLNVVSTEIERLNFYNSISEISIYNKTAETFENDVNKCVANGGVEKCSGEIARIEGKYEFLIEQADKIIKWNNQKDYYLAYFSTLEDFETFKNSLRTYKLNLKDRYDYFHYISLKLSLNYYSNEVDNDARELSKCFETELNNWCDGQEVNLIKLYDRVIELCKEMQSFMSQTYSLKRSFGADVIESDKENVKQMISTLQDAQNKLVNYRLNNH